MIMNELVFLGRCNFISCERRHIAQGKEATNVRHVSGGSRSHLEDKNKIELPRCGLSLGPSVPSFPETATAPPHECQRSVRVTGREGEGG